MVRTSEQSTPARPAVHVQVPSFCREESFFLGGGTVKKLVLDPISRGGNLYAEAGGRRHTFHSPHRRRTINRCCSPSGRRNTSGLPRGATQNSAAERTSPPRAEAEATPSLNLTCLALNLWSTPAKKRTSFPLWKRFFTQKETLLFGALAPTTTPQPLLITRAL